MTTTSSVLEFKPVHGTHEFTVVGYSFSKLFDYGYAVKSETFKVGDRSWSIVFYPLGSKKPSDSDDAGSISIFLELVDPLDDVKVKFDVTLLDQSVVEEDNVEKSHFTMPKNNRKFSSVTRYSGWSDFMKISKLESSNYLKGDCIRIRCSIMIVLPGTAKASHAHDHSVIPFPSSSTIFNDLKRLLESGNGCDVTFEVDGQKFSAHKSIMAARSPVFNALFFGSFSDPNTKCVSIQQMDAPAFKGLLDFIYCDELSGEISCSMYQSLLFAADRYDFGPLKTYCQIKLCEDMSVEEVSTLLITAELTNSCALKSACLEYMASPENVETVMETEGFREIVEHHSQLLTEVMKANVRRNKRMRLSLTL